MSGIQPASHLFATGLFLFEKGVPFVKKLASTLDPVLAAQLQFTSSYAKADDLREILRRMCRSIADPQGNLLYDFLCIIDPKVRDKVHRRFIKLLIEELGNQHDYQHLHQGEQGPPTGRFVGVKGPWREVAKAKAKAKVAAST